ncbi:MAG: DUF4340 domain-containing protein [Burkholderiales bacterium]
MSSRIAAIFIILAVAALGGSWFLLKDEGKSSPSAVKLGQTLFPQLQAEAIAGIVVAAPQGTLTLAKKDNRWVMAEAGGFPADIDRVTELVVKAIELKTGQSEPIAEKERARMLLGPPGKGEGAATSVAFKDKDGRVLAELLVGKKYFRNEPAGDPTKALGDGRFVMLASDTTRVIVVSDPLRLASINANDWISREGFSVENVKTLEVKQADGGYRLTREVADGNFVLEGKGGELDPFKASGASLALMRLEVEDLAAAGTDAGFDKGATILASTFDGLNYTIKVGALAKDRYPVQVSVEGTPTRAPKPAPAKPDEKAEDKDKREKAAADDVKKFGERIAREKALGPFTVMIAKAKFDEVLKKRDEFLKKEEKKDGDKKDEKKADKKGAKK